jgi:enhancing lycopene biosynthesis protein 2
MKKFAVVLAGCGVFDGAEIQEAVLCMLAIKRQGATYQCFAPDVEQHHVINHLTGEEMNEERNFLTEAARIDRGQVKPLSEYNAEEFDALVFSGGFGVAKNLSTIAFDGANAAVLADVEKAINTTYDEVKPIGAMCISPALIARIIEGASLTIGDEKETIEVIEKMGGKHVLASHGDVVMDEENLIFSTPCYMLDAQITDIDDGANNMIKAMIKHL